MNVRLTLLLIIVPFCSGCLSHQPADPDSRAVIELPELVWPHRIDTHIESIVADIGTRPVPIVSILLPANDHTRHPIVFSRDATSFVHAERFDHGVVVETFGDPGDGEALRSTVLQYVSHDPLLDVTDANPMNGTEFFHAFSGGHRAIVHRPAGTTRGLVIVYQGLGGHEIVRCFISDLVKDDWTVLEADFPLIFRRKTRVDVDTVGSVEDATRLATKLVDSHLAEHAYATEAILRYLERHHPEIPQDRVACVGFSGGALLLPAAVSRVHDRVDAIVMAFGGVNILEIGSESVLSKDGFIVSRASSPLTPDEQRRAYDEYASAAQFDPMHLAPPLRSKPILMLHAATDKIVPAKAGEALYQLLGKPERIRFNGGHKVAFFTFQFHMNRVRRWLDRNTR